MLQYIYGPIYTNKYNNDNFSGYYNNFNRYRPQLFNPEYKINNKERKRFNTYYSYIASKYPEDKIDLHVFYNTSKDSDSDGSTYKYTIPKSIDDKKEPSHLSISEKQKRFRRELFDGSIGSDESSENNFKNLDISYYIIILILIIIVLYIPYN
jgi:hypothetical protein